MCSVFLQAFTLSGDQVIGGPCVKSIAPVHKWNNYLTTNTADNIRLVSDVQQS